MRVQHNIMAMNSYRNYNNNVSALSANLEKLSSGYRINRAGDDAAGLAISEKMRAQITGLDAAQKNVKDGISLVKTAEGALQEVQDMMNRMVYLAEQSANGTYDNAVDRKALQEEVNALTQEIDRIAKSANFNGQKLLDGSLMTGGTAEVGFSGSINNTAITSSSDIETLVASAVAGDKVVIDGTEYTYEAGATGTEGDNTFSDWDSLKAAALENDVTLTTTTEGGTEQTTALTATNKAGDAVSTATGAKFTTGTIATTGNTSKNDAVLTVAYKDADGNAQTVEVTVNTGASANASLTAIVGDLAGNATLSALFDVTEGTNAAVFETKAGKGAAVVTGVTVKTTGTDGVSITGAGTSAAAQPAAFTTANWNTGDSITVDGTDYAFADYGTTAALKTALEDAGITVTEAAGTWTFSKTETTGGTKSTTATKPGAPLTLQIGDTSDDYNKLEVSVDSMKAADLFNGAIDISAQGLAQDAIDTIKNAINTVSAQRGRLGAIQNRLEHTQNNLSVMEENITDAESTIRDTDVADEMMAYTKNNILIQTSQAMLAQANMVPQGVLSLLQ